MAFPSMLVWAVSSPAMAYVYYGVMKLPRGSIRLLAALPLIAFYLSIAKGFPTVFERGTYSFFFIWLTSFKIVLLCWDDGPAADPWAVASFPRFLAVMNFSLQIKRQKFADRSKKTAIPPKAMDSISSTNAIVSRTRRHSADAIAESSETLEQSRRSSETLKQSRRSSETQKQSWIVARVLRGVDESQEMQTVVVKLLFKFVCLMGMTYLFAYRASIPLGLLSVLYSFYIYVTCSLIFEGIAAVVSPLMGIELEPSFDKPFLAHSLADFWGKRWNLLVSNLLRVSVYDPVLRFLLWSEGSTSPSPGTTTMTSAAPYASRLPLWARSVAMFSCFLVSGLMHELIFHIMSRSKPTWEVTFFFVLNGAAAILEGALRRKTRLRLPKYVSTPLTLTFVLVTAIWFFYPPLVDSGTADHAIAEFQYFFQTLNHLVGAS